MSRNIPSGLQPEFYRLFTRPLTIAELYLESPYTTPSHYYVANNEDIVFGGTTYTALAAKRTSIKSEEGTIINELEVGLDNVDLAFRSLIASGAFNRKRCVLKLVFVGFLTSADNYVILYDGYLDAPKGDDHWVTLTLKPFPIFEREYPRRLFQVGCNFTFCDDQCGLTLTDYDMQLTVAAGSTDVLINFTGGTPDEDYFSPGYILMTSGDLDTQNRPIASNTTSSITLRIPLESAPEVGDTFTAQKLCSKSTDSCIGFNNYLNYGGFPSVPLEPVL